MRTLTLRCSAALALMASVLVPLGSAAAAAPEAPDGLEGSGTAADPYLIGTEEELVRWAELLNAADAAYTGTKTFRLTDDIALTGANTVPMVRDFDGTLDGAGHTISGYTLEVALPETNPNGFRAGFIVRNDGTIRNLTLDDLEVTCTGDNGTATGPTCAGLVAENYGAIVASAVEGTVTAPGMEKVAGIAGASFGGTIRDVAFTGAVTGSFMPAGVVSYGNNAATIERAVVDADLVATSTKPAAGRTTQQGNDAGLVIAYPNNVTIRSSVVTGGSISYAYPGGTPGFYGRISGYDGFSRTLSGNHAYADVLINGVAVTGTATDQQGQDTDAATLRDPGFYASLGFDLETVWQLDETTGVPVLRDPVETEPVPPLSGAGTAADPYLIGTEDEFHHWSALVNDRANLEHSGARYYRITADIALTRPFTMVNQFRGNLDGTGHTVSGLVVTGDLSTRNVVAMIAENSGVVENLVLDGVDVTMTGDRGPITGPTAAGLVGRNLSGGLVQSVAVTGSVEARGAEKAAGLVGENLGGVIRDCSFEGDVTANLMAAGVAGYNNGNGSVQRCLVDADVTTVSTQPVQGRDEQRGNDAGLLLAYPNTGSVQASVAYGGSISYAYPGVTPGFYGRISGYDGYSRLLRDNLANTAVTINGATVSGQAGDQNGADRSAEQLADRATYEALGWDFGYTWGWDADRSRPVLSYADTSMRPDRVTVTFHGDARTRRGFTWYTSAEAAEPVVRLSTSPDLTDAVEIAAEPLARAGAVRHQAVADGLTPGTTYYYRVGDAASGNFSPTGTFRTAGDGDDAFSFVALTDTQSQSEAEAQLSAETMAKSLAAVPDAAFMLHSGDVVERGTDESMWQDLLNQAGGSLMATTIAPAAGNHDTGGEAFVDHFNVERNGDTTDGSYYSYDYGSAHFAVLNTNEDAAQAVSPEQLDWLRADVTAARAAGAEWVIVNLHKGPYTTAVHVDDPEVVRLRETLVPLMDELDVDLVFQGHDHIYARTRQLDHDPEGVANATVVETTRYTELVGGKRIEYTLDTEGIRYLLPNTAGAKHYDQNTNPDGLDMGAYLGLFDRSDQGRTSAADERDAQYFAEVSIDGGMLDVVMYQIKDRAQPFALEGFGIDREVQPVIDQIAALPEPGRATDADRPAVAAARTAYDALTRGQRSAVADAGRLAELERELATSGGAVPWHVDGADGRQSVAVRNTTDADVTDQPVLLRLDAVPAGTAPGALRLLDAAGHPVPFEVEHWDPAGRTTVWARVARIGAGAAAHLWAYYGVAPEANDPADVWRGDHLLVEHFARSAEPGAVLTDSTGRSTGTVEGAGLVASTGPRGTRTADFAGTKISYDDVGAGLDRITVSAVVTVAGEQSQDLAAIIAKDLLGDGAGDTFRLSLDASDRRLLAAHVGTWYQSSATTRRASEGGTELPADGEPHLVTLTYDGMTFAAYLDGELIHQNFAEYRTTLSDPDTPTSIGAFSDPGIVRGAFTGTLDEVQLTGASTSPALEEFRYAAWFGDAVGYGDVEPRDGSVGLTVSYPQDGAAVEAGPVTVSGVVTQDVTLTATVGGQRHELGDVPAGEFRVDVPVYVPGEQEVELTASAEDGDATATLPLEVTDTAAPARPELDDTAVDGIVAIGHDPAELSAEVEAGTAEATSVRFMRSQSIELDAKQVTMRSGTTEASLPDDLLPADGTESAEPFAATSGEGVTPYQIFDVALTPQQARAESYRFTWTGSAEREVTGYYWDHAAGAWVKAGTAYGPDGAEASMDLVVPRSAANGRTVTVLLWRGLGTPVAGRSSYVPSAGQFDFSYALIPDTQLYTQSTPEIFRRQTEHIAEQAEENKTVMALHLGDVVNRPWLSEEYQWEAADAAMDVLDEADVPYAITWGNHDYDNGTNSRVLYDRWFSAERLRESAGELWGDSRGIDDAYYLMEQDGAEIMVLSVGFWASDADLAWAADAIEAHPDHSVILLTHSYTGSPGGLSGEGGRIRDALVAPYENVKLILSGHVSGVGLHYESIDGRPVYGVLQDYQGMPFGGFGFLRHMKVDVENDLIYFNTYSPYTGETTSPYGNRQMTVPGTYYQTDADNFAIPVDLGGTSQRTLTTSSLLLATAEDVALGEPVELTGAGTATLDLESVLDLRPRTTVRWYAVLTDAAGNRTVSDQRSFAVERYRPGLPRP
ncbi:metallophosphoesterase [Jiangella sp. DSM 45060]|uniref:metallophosphoesterase n=1 Tax=Jiangella sp. DSM 45060 TaxID=1798224 RepID=UPI000879FFB5|nr:metallophosphoesterase [Jiangella sp. DSM 45060]SDS24158.1 Concanavalin A-like lectin/glucanases superfamily protein [Jiangella sp. DSM 45060]